MVEEGNSPLVCRCGEREHGDKRARKREEEMKIRLYDIMTKI